MLACLVANLRRHTYINLCQRSCTNLYRDKMAIYTDTSFEKKKSIVAIYVNNLLAYLHINCYMHNI